MNDANGIKRNLGGAASCGAVAKSDVPVQRDFGRFKGSSPTRWLDDLTVVFGRVVREISDAFERGDDFHPVSHW